MKKNIISLAILFVLLVILVSIPKTYAASTEIEK